MYWITFLLLRLCLFFLQAWIGSWIWNSLVSPNITGVPDLTFHAALGIVLFLAIMVPTGFLNRDTETKAE